MQGMNSRTQMSIAHVTNYTNTGANLQSISNLDMEMRGGGGEEKHTCCVSVRNTGSGRPHKPSAGKDAVEITFSIRDE